MGNFSVISLLRRVSLALLPILFLIGGDVRGQVPVQEFEARVQAGPLKTEPREVWSAVTRVLDRFPTERERLLFETELRVEPGRLRTRQWIMEKHTLDKSDGFVFATQATVKPPKIQYRVFTSEGDAPVLSGDTILKRDVNGEAWKPHSIQTFRIEFDEDNPGAILEMVVDYDESIKDNDPFFRKIDMDRDAVVRRVRLINLQDSLETGVVGELPAEQSGEKEQVTSYRAINFLAGSRRYVPRDQVASPYVYLRRSVSWQSVSQRLAKRTDEWIDGLEKSAQGILSAVKKDLNGSPTVEQIHRCVAQTRIEDIPFESDLESRRAALLVAVLRGLGMEAYLALAAQDSLHVPPTLPSDQHFDRRLVVVRQQNGGLLWIDPWIEHLPVNQLTLPLQGRPALIGDGQQNALSETPVAESTRREFRRIVTNYSGIGTAQVRTRASGPMAALLSIELPLNDQRNQLEKWKPLWQSEFPRGRLTEIKLTSLDLDNVVDDYEVAARMTIGGLSDVPGEIFVHGESLLEHLPGIFSDRALGFGEAEFTDRRVAAVFPSKMTLQSSYEVWYPAVCNPVVNRNWERKIGNFTLSATYRLFRKAQVGDVPAFPKQSKMKTVFSFGTERMRLDGAGSEVTPLDSIRDKMNALQVTFRATIEPGQISAAQVNEIRDVLLELANQSDLSHYIDLDGGEPGLFGSRTIGMARLQEIGNAFPSDPGPRMAMARRLQKFGLEKEAAKQVQIARQSGPLSVQQTIESLELLISLPRERQDFASLKQALISDLESQPTLDPKDLQTLIHATLSGSKAGFSFEEKSVLNALKWLKRQTPDPNFDGLAYEVSELGTLLRLSINQDSTLPKPDFVNNVERILQAVAANESLREQLDLEPTDIEAAWCQLASIGRYDLVSRFRELLALGVKQSVLELPAEFDGSVPELDQLNPSSVARHLMLAMLRGDLDTIRSLSLSPNHLPLTQADAGKVHRLFRRWIPDSNALPIMANDALYKALAMGARIEDVPIGWYGHDIKMNGYGGRWSRFRLVRTPDDERYFAVHSYNVDSIAPHLLELMDQGEMETVEAWQRQIFDRLIYQLDKENLHSGSCAAHILSGVDSLNEDLLRLVCQVMDCGTKFGTSAAALEEDLENGRWLHHELQIRRILKSYYENTNQPAKEFPHQLWLAKEAPERRQYIRRLCVLARELRLKQEEPEGFLDWMDPVYEYLAGDLDPNDLFYIRAAMARAQDDSGLEYDLMRRAIEDLSDDESEEIKNMLLWWSLVDGVGRRELFGRESAASGLMLADSVAYLHTLACTQAVLGRIEEIDENIVRQCREDAISQGSAAELLVGLIALQLGEEEAARERFRATIELDNDFDCVEIAKRMLKGKWAE